MLIRKFDFINILLYTIDVLPYINLNCLIDDKNLKKEVSKKLNSENILELYKDYNDYSYIGEWEIEYLADFKLLCNFVLKHPEHKDLLEDFVKL